MGVQGLRKLIETSGCARQLSASTSQPQDRTNDTDVNQQQQQKQPEIVVDHVLIDMNGVIHGAFTRAEPDSKATIKNVVAALRFLLENVVFPRRSLILCFDGPAPYAKLNTQRQRRRKVSHLDVANNANFSDLSITTGSVFMLELEQTISRFLNQHSSSSSSTTSRPPPSSSPSHDAPSILAKCANISICGSSVPGEGEAKIANSLARIAATVARSENDSVIVVGNDIDLVLTCIGATSFHNIGVLNPQTFQVIDVGSFLARWVAPEDPMSVTKSTAAIDRKKRISKGQSGRIIQDERHHENARQVQGLVHQEAAVAKEISGLHHTAAGFVSFANLPGARIDFVWLFMLNGSDYYDGLGDAALSLWKRYRMLKKQHPEFRLVSKTHSLITNALRSLFQCEQVEVAGDKVGLGKGKGGKRRQRDGGEEFHDFDAEADDDLGKNDRGDRRGAKDPGQDDENERRRGALTLSPEQKHAAIGLMNASLWALITTVTGVCPNYKFRPVDPKQYEDSQYVSYATMRAAVATHEEETVSYHLPKHFEAQIRNFEQERRRRQHEKAKGQSSQYSREEMREWFSRKNRKEHLQRNFVTAEKFPILPIQHPLAPLSPLQTFVALMPRKELLPAPIAKILEKDQELYKSWSTQSFGGHAVEHLPEVVRKIFKMVDVKDLTAAERFLTQFGDPVDVKGGFFRGHPHGGVARKDQEGNRKYGIDFFRFAYGSKASSNVLFPKIAPDLVPGARKMNAVSAKVKKLLLRKEKLAAKVVAAKKGKKATNNNNNTTKAGKKSAIGESGAGGVAAAAAGKKQDKKKMSPAAIEQQVSQGTTMNRLKKNKDGEVVGAGGKRLLYWFDVFNKASRDSAMSSK